MSDKRPPLVLNLGDETVGALEKIAEYRGYGEWDKQERCEVALEHSLIDKLVICEAVASGAIILVEQPDGYTERLIVK